MSGQAWHILDLLPYCRRRAVLERNRTRYVVPCSNKLRRLARDVERLTSLQHIMQLVLHIQNQYIFVIIQVALLSLGETDMIVQYMPSAITIHLLLSGRIVRIRS